MNIYRMIGSNLGTHEAAELAERLSAWHDAMVAHERKPLWARGCGDECPHVDARVLWEEAAGTFGDRAGELQFLQSHGLRTSTAAAPAHQEAGA